MGTKKTLLGICACLQAWGAWASPRSFEVIVKVPARTPARDTLYLTGDAPSLCNWKPDCLALERIGEGTYRAVVDGLQGVDAFNFKVTRGSWKTEAADPHGNPLENTKVEVGSGQPFVLMVPTWADAGSLGVTGHLERIEDFYSPQLNNSRTVSVWLPPGYGSNKEQRYPVLYMHDGQNVFDPSTSTWGIDWGVDEAVTDLAKAGQRETPIVVAIDCNSKRSEEYDVSKNGERYAAFLIETVKPFVDSHYRTRPGRESTAVMGSSMGALISLTLLWNHSDVFSRAGAVSVPAMYEKEMIVRFIEEHPAPKNIRLYMDHGDWGDDSSYAPAARRLQKALLKSGLPERQLQYSVYPYAEHSEADWSRRVHVPLEFLFDAR